MNNKELVLVRQPDGKWAVEAPAQQDHAGHALARDPRTLSASGGGIASMEIAGIPIGEAAIGGIAALVVTELVSGFMANQTAMPKWLGKGLAAWALVSFGGRFLPGDSAKIGAAFIAFDALRDLVPIDKQIAGFFKKDDKAPPAETSARAASNGHNPALSRLGTTNI